MKTPRNKDRFDSSDRAVSPVIGVILMVAITVILAAVIGTFVLDLGQSAGKSAPQASLTVNMNANGDFVNVSHQGGDSLDAKQTRVVIKNVTASGTTSFNTTTSSHVMSVGDTEAFHLAASSSVDAGSWTGMTAKSTDNIDGIKQGNQYKVQFIDTNSQRVIYSTTVTA